MQGLSDILLASAALGAALYCSILSRRLRALGSLEGGMGSAIAILSRQVDELARALSAAQDSAGRSAQTLDTQTARAEATARRLQLLVASLHDLPAQDAAPPPDKPLARPPTPWPNETRARPEPRSPLPPAVSDAHDDDGPRDSPARARILRRRPQQGEF